MNAVTKREVVEWAPFQVAEDVTEERLLQASRDLQEEFLAKQRGFLRRDLLRSKEREWVDIVYWADQEAANDAIKAAAESAVCYAYFALMVGADHDAPGESVLHFERVASYP